MFSGKYCTDFNINYFHLIALTQYQTHEIKKRRMPVNDNCADFIHSNLLNFGDYQSAAGDGSLVESYDGEGDYSDLFADGGSEEYEFIEYDIEGEDYGESIGEGEYEKDEIYLSVTNVAGRRNPKGKSGKSKVSLGRNKAKLDPLIPKDKFPLPKHLRQNLPISETCLNECHMQFRQIQPCQDMQPFCDGLTLFIRQDSKCSIEYLDDNSCQINFLGEICLNFYENKHTWQDVTFTKLKGEMVENNPKYAQLGLASQSMGSGGQVKHRLVRSIRSVNLTEVETSANETDQVDSQNIAKNRHDHSNREPGFWTYSVAMMTIGTIIGLLVLLCVCKFRIRT